MIKLAWQLISSQKKWFCLLVFICVMTFVTTTLFQTVATMTEKYTIEQAQKKYGDFTGLLADVDENRQQLEDTVLKIGEYGIDAAIQEKQTAIQIGFFDEAAFQMAQFQLIEGHLPKNASEVIIEEAYLAKLEGSRWKVGERKKIGNDQLKLVGIIKNYSANWAVNIDVSSKHYGFPNIIQLKTQQTKQEKHSFLLKENNSLNNDDSKFASKYGVNYMVNDQFYYQGLQQYKVLRIVKSIFFTVLLIVSSISMFQVLTVYYKKQQILYTLLKIEGATKRQIEIIKALQICWVMCIASVLALPTSYVLHQLLARYLFEYDVTMRWSDQLLGLILPILLLSSTIFLQKIKLKRFKKISILYSLNMLVLISILLLLFTSIFIYKEEIESPSQSHTLIVSANRITQTMEVDGFDVALPPRKYIQENEVQKMQTYEGVTAINVTALTDDLKITQRSATTGNLEETTALNEATFLPIRMQNKLVHTLQIEKYLAKNQAILIVPTKAIQQKYQSKIGGKLVMRRSDSEGNIQSWTYKIAAIKVVDSRNPNMKIVINAKKAIQTNLFLGFNDVEITVSPTISKEAYATIFSDMSSLSALYNDGILEENEKPLAKLFTSYYVITFIVSIVFSCLTIYFMIDRKLEERGYIWGIYLSQGMTKRKVWLLLIKTIPLLWLQAVLSSSTILLILYINQDYVSHSLLSYTKIYISIASLIFVLFLIVAFLFLKKINQLSIRQLLKRAIVHE